MNKFYYVTVASGENFIRTYTAYAVKSLIRTGVPCSGINIVGNTDSDLKLLKELLPGDINFYKLEEDLSIVKWKSFGGKRKYSLLKAAALYKFFGKPIENKYMVYFDGDVLWYKDPTSFLETKCKKTWFHHGKALNKRSEAGRKGLTYRDIDVRNYISLSSWCSEPQAHLMIKFGAKIVPEREVVAGFYLLHPKDHEKVLRMTYEGCLENCDKFLTHEGAGDQKPMNAALAILEIDWHGGSRFFCPEHKEYFDHFFGKKDLKEVFSRKVKEMGL
jgi:hypothetical protein